ncbi:MAG: hypothetical protein QOE60_193, partial [Thermoleophilaceae bacterium]|nr:hypothetical protein [Thermoleophilaceae bacterium]
MLVVVVGCVYFATAASRNELDGAYRDSAQEALNGAVLAFRNQADNPGRLSTLMRSRPELESASIHRSGQRVVSIGHPTSHAERLVTPFDGGRELVLTYDMRP